MKPNTSQSTAPSSSRAPKADLHIGVGGEVHQVSGANGQKLTTNHGMVVSDDTNSLRGGERGPILLEDFVLREKIFHFDHERIPERVVHARGLAAHGYFELTHALTSVTTAQVLSEIGEKIPVFVRFSTVAGNKGSADLARDVRGFAVKFYTQQGNWDLVGNNIPVFFIQDAMKFPDLAHAVKEEPDRGFPQAASAHDTFWDWIAMTPEAMHMVMWQMSDRTIPRSMRMMQGFGVHSFRLINDEGVSTFVKFHWVPKLGLQSVCWDEAVKINGADPDFHRRDLYEAIEAGDFPEWDLSVQLFSEEDAAKFDFDHLDPTKLIPEEIIPLTVIGRLVLNQNPANVFAETEQVAYCTQNLVPGIDFSDDPLLHGRNFSYLDTQLSRLGSTNFNQIPINAPKCPFANMQRDGHMQTLVHPQRVTYTPSLLDPTGPRESRETGFRSFPTPLTGVKQRERSATFSDHYSQARQFFISQNDVEQNHLVGGLIFELSKVESPLVRSVMLGHLVVIDDALGSRVALGLGHKDKIVPATPAASVRRDLPAAPSLSLMSRSLETLEGRTIGILLGEGCDADEFTALTTAISQAKANYKIICSKIGGVTASDGTLIPATMQLNGAPSVLFDAVAILSAPDAVKAWLLETSAIAWVQDAYAHLKVIGAVEAAKPLLDRAGVVQDAGVIEINGSNKAFVDAASTGRIWDREPSVRTIF